MDQIPIPELPVQLVATKSSRFWNSVPGNWDRLNCRALYPGDERWGIPELPACDWVPQKLIAYTSRKGLDVATSDTAVHFFLDDYRFETMWSRPNVALDRCMRAGGILTPDFSLWPAMPLAMQLWQIYRSRWCGAWAHNRGFKVIPTVGWSTPVSFDFCFLGLPHRSVVAVSTVGCVRNPDARKGFLTGYREMVRRLEPSVIVLYGRRLPGMEENIVDFLNLRPSDAIMGNRSGSDSNAVRDSPSVRAVSGK